MEELERFVQSRLTKSGKVVPARLQAALALLERLRDHPSLQLTDHLAAPGSAGLGSHETFGDRVHLRLDLTPINRNHGRRSSNLQDWGQELLDHVKSRRFQKSPPARQSEILDGLQAELASKLKAILEQDPITVRVRNRSAESAICDILQQASEKGKSGDVAEYLVRAKLSIRFGVELPVHPANKADRRSRTDESSRLGDIEFEDAIIEVAMGPPDVKHFNQIVEVLEKSDFEVWLLTDAERVDAWKRELSRSGDVDMNRVVVSSVEAFVGQNLTELGEFKQQGKTDQLRELIRLYNERWVAQVGTPGIRIVIR